ncbi:MAG: tetratricopeptide repeat protein [Anaerolineaceae bacterium]|nr:tetratricopeptide repeat protein [Anaerolineaceae bacterium]
MYDLADKLMGRQQSKSGGGLETAIFGSASSLADAIDAGGPRLRIGLWPVRSTTAPQVAMGLAGLLGFLLEDWSSDLRVYRLFASLDGDPADYAWLPEKSQFDVDDWGLDDLDENVAIWGTLETAREKWSLTLEVENDLADEPDDLKQFRYETDNLAQLVAGLPKIAAEIAAFLEAGDPNISRRPYQIGGWKDADLERVLGQLFANEVSLLLHLWGKEWGAEQAKPELERFFEACAALSGDIGGWLAAHGLARILNPIFHPLDSLLFPLVGRLVSMFEQSVFPYILLSSAVARLDSLKRGCELMEDAAVRFESDVIFWINLGRMYYRNRHFFEAVDAYQRGIGAADVPAAYYMEYAELLGLMDMAGVQFDFDNDRVGITGRTFVDGVVLADLENVEPENVLAVEVIAAYRAVLKSESSAGVLHALVMQLIEMEDYDAVWNDFELLVSADDKGDYVRQVIEALVSVPDAGPAVRVLRQAVVRSPDRFDLLRNLGHVLLLDEQYAEARDVLDKARDLAAGDKAACVEVDRLLLTADDPDFEAAMAELTTLINAGVSPKADDVDFLEHALEKVPTLAEAYLLLAQAYIKWGETDDALEVLLDGQKHLPDHPRVLEMLVGTLWRSDERELALRYLNRGLAANPVDVPLLALAGRCMFESGQDEQAKSFLLRAEAIAPRDPALSAVRAYIAKSMN